MYPDNAGFIRRNFWLLLILSVAAVLRFHHLGDFSLSNDELSALVRTDYSSFDELMEKGVRVDAHPAGIQVFLYYWLKIVGRSEFAFRFPFAVAGVLSVLFIYLLGKSWFGKINGLMAAAALAVLQFPLLYSQIARPYAFGLLFTLAAAWCWTLLLFPPPGFSRKKNRVAAAGFTLSLAACAYTHYFSMLMGGIIAASGFLFVKKDTLKIYILSCFLSAVLFLPHLSIFFRQLSYKGVGSWLGAPKDDFLEKFFDAGFNDSAWLQIFFVVLCAVPFLLFPSRAKNPKFYLLCLAWYLVPYFTGYWYSVKINPVMQHSTLLFSFPYLLLFFTGFVPGDKLNAPIRNVLIAGVLCAGLFSTVSENKYYSTNHFGVFRELAENTIAWNDKYGAKNTTAVYNLTSPSYIQYYFEKFHRKAEARMFSVNDAASIARLRDLADTATTAYFLYGWSNVYHPLEAIDFIRDKYPVAVEQDTFFNSSITLYGKEGRVAAGDGMIFHSETSYEKNSWGEEEKLRDSTAAHSGKYSEDLEGKEYSLTSTRKLNEINAHPGDVISIAAWFYSTDSAATGQLVMSFEDNGQSVQWLGTSAAPYNTQPGRWQKIILSARIPEEMNRGGEVKCYFWNPDKKKIRIDDLSITLRSQHYYR